MEFKKTFIDGVYVIEPEVLEDNRGYFFESFKQQEFEQAVGYIDFVQDNESVSSRGVLRGLHFQGGEWSQAKLVRVSQGRVIDVVVDLRRESATFGKHLMVELDRKSVV